MSRRSRAVLLVWIVVVGSSAEGVAAGQVRSADHAASEGVCAFSGTQMWGSDYGHSLERMGLSYPALYVARGSPVRLRRLPILGDAGAMWAAACPQGDLVAYVSSPIGKSEPQVVIADTSGRVLASFPGAVRCGWSWDGHRLAAEFGRLDVRTDPVFENKGESDSVMVWERATGSRRVFAVRPMAWNGAGAIRCS